MTEKEAQAINTGRLLRAESDVMLPMLAERREHAVQKILLYFRSGEFEKIRDCAAELCVMDDLQNKIKNKIRAADAAERRMTNGDNNGNQ